MFWDLISSNRVSRSGRNRTARNPPHSGGDRLKRGRHIRKNSASRALEFGIPDSAFNISVPSPLPLLPLLSLLVRFVEKVSRKHEHGVVVDARRVYGGSACRVRSRDGHESHGGRQNPVAVAGRACRKGTSQKSLHGRLPGSPHHRRERGHKR
jgi:hypothetical protein